MRKYAKIKNNSKYKKIMIAEVSLDYCIFLYDVEEDVLAKLSRRFRQWDEVDSFVSKIDGTIEDWIEIDDPMEGCNYDLIVNAKKADKHEGSNEINLWEHYINGEWRKFLLLDTMEWKSVD